MTLDPEVIAALARWPDVPAVYGWLALDRRGNWRLRGEPVANEAIRAFISRNYDADPSGCWYFQNGPQRVYVALELAPWICRIAERGLTTQTGRPVDHCAGVLVDEAGCLWLETPIGPAAIDDRDAARVPALLVDEGGRPLDDRAIEAWLSGAGGASLKWPGTAELHPIRRIRRDAIESELAFVAAPAPTSSRPDRRPSSHP